MLGKQNNTMKKLSSNMEDYMEVIHNLTVKNKVARVKDIADTLDVRMPSVTGAVHRLSEMGLIQNKKYGYIELTDQGRRISRDIIKRHRIISTFLKDVLDIDPEIADRDACDMEHVVSNMTLDRLSRFSEFVQTCLECTGTCPKWKEGFRYYYETGEFAQLCKMNQDETG